MSEIAVVGAGVNGLAAARALAAEDHRVVVHERFAAGHARGSSHGRTRIYRLAYPDRAWLELAREALDGWRALERETGETLLEENGLLEIVEPGDPGSSAALAAAGVEHERLDAADVRRRFGLRLPDRLAAFFQPDAGVVHADRALAALARGLDIRYESPVGSLDELDADIVVVAAGAWVNDLVEPPLPVRVTRETVCFFTLAHRELPVPSVIAFEPGSGGEAYYALADPVHGLKAGVHKAGVETDPNEPGIADEALVERVTAWADARFELALPEPVARDTCLYTLAPEDAFLLERRGRVVIGSACSGHGFKFAPAVGARLAQLAAPG